MRSASVIEQLNVMQHPFLPASAISDSMRKNMCCFWESQDKIVEAMHVFANGWFERRHAGARAALEATEHICRAQTPVEMQRTYQDWASGAVHRVIADGVACQQQLITVAWLLVLPVAGENERLSPQAAPRTSVRSNAA